MTYYKMKKVHYTNLEKLLHDVGLVDKTGKEAYPSSYFVSKETYKLIKKALDKECKKVHPNATKHYRDNAVGMYMLNLAPVILDCIKTGYVLVDTLDQGA